MVYNKSKTYLLPLLSELIPLKAEYIRYVKNTYMTTDIEGHDNCICILHDFSFRIPEFTAYENELTDNELFVDLVDIDNQVLYIFKFPEEYMHEYNAFKEGRYSAFGTDAKDLILSFWTEVYSSNIKAVDFLLKVKQVLFKDKKLKQQIEEDLNVKLDDDSELGQMYDSELEHIKLQKNKQKVKK